MTIEDIIVACEEVFSKLTIDPIRAEFALQMITRMCEGDANPDQIKQMALFGLKRDDGEDTPTDPAPKV